MAPSGTPTSFSTSSASTLLTRLGSRMAKAIWSFSLLLKPLPIWEEYRTIGYQFDKARFYYSGVNMPIDGWVLPVGSSLDWSSWLLFYWLQGIKQKRKKKFCKLTFFVFFFSLIHTKGFYIALFQFQFFWQRQCDICLFLLSSRQLFSVFLSLPFIDWYSSILYFTAIRTYVHFLVFGFSCTFHVPSFQRYIKKVTKKTVHSFSFLRVPSSFTFTAFCSVFDFHFSSNNSTLLS